jgi:hypothetical protein
MNLLRASTVFIAMLAAATAASGASRPRRAA